MKRITFGRGMRFVCWTAIFGSLAVATAARLPGFDPTSALTGKRSNNRTSIDPPVPAKGKMGQDLFFALDHRDVAALSGLLAQGADPNSRNGLEFTPLMVAVASHQPEAAAELLKAGADPNIKSIYGQALGFASSSANVADAVKLIELGNDVNDRRADGMTPLMAAALSGSPDMVKALLDKKADVNAADDFGSTSLALAARTGATPVVGMLLKAKASVNDHDVDHQTPLMLAAMNGHADVVRMLLAHGAKPADRDAEGRTPLMLAASYGDFPDVVKLLLATKSAPGAKDAKGRTAADLASIRGRLASAKLLGKPVAPITKTPRQAAQAGLRIVQASTLQFGRTTNCISCHHEGLGPMATSLASARGLKTNAAATKIALARIEGVLNAMQPLHSAALKSPEVMKQVPLVEINEVSSTDAWLLGALAANHRPATAATAAMAEVLAKQQLPDGSWSFSVPRAPMQSSFATFTALSVLSLQRYAPKANAADTAGRIERARHWLATTPAKTSEDRAFRLLGLKWSGGSAADITAAAEAVRKDQRPDGGWSQLPGMPSDAYATGQSLYALREGTGMPATERTYRAGVAYLLRTQDDDGSWFVTKRAFPNNNHFGSGFPHGQSQYSSFNGTCWATMALAATLPDRARAVARN